jgi:SAM-dependent MidA family methyltransferase
LPEPDEAAQQRSDELVQCIVSACEQQGGVIPFSRYMEIALYQPGLGYYSGGLQKFGERGDFITAPEVSPMFAQCFARQIRQLLDNFHDQGIENIDIIEFGAGSGVFAADLLAELERLGALPRRYLIIELSAELQQRQKHRLDKDVPHLASRVTWIQALPDRVDAAVVIANEVLDAMPVEIFSTGTDGTDMVAIASDQGRLEQVLTPASENVLTKLADIEQRSGTSFEPGYRSELNLSIPGWLAGLEAAIEQMVLFIIDYGYNEREYFHADRRDGTMMCYYRHRAHADPLWWPGLQDITAFVDFTDVAYAAVELGLEVAGYTTQAAFLLANGLADLHAEQVPEGTDTASIQRQVSLSQQVKTLTLPSEMGDRFKVLAVAKNFHHDISGFALLDLRNRL